MFREKHKFPLQPVVNVTMETEFYSVIDDYTFEKTTCPSTTNNNNNNNNIRNGLPETFQDEDEKKNTTLNSELQNNNGCSANENSDNDETPRLIFTNKEFDKRINNNDSLYLFSKTSAEELPADLRSFFSGIKQELPDEIEPPVDVFPDWLDIEKVRKGQQFARKYYYAVNMAEMLGLMVLFAPSNGIDPLVYTEKSHTPFLAYKRYLSTICRVKSWYDTEFWKPNTLGYDNLKTVRRLHRNVQKRMMTDDLVECKRRTDLQSKLAKDGKSLWCPLISSISKDLNNNDTSSSSSCPYAVIMTGERKLHLNQFDMSMTQIAFYGIFLLYHKKLGASLATDDDLECYVHLWRYLGYLLAIDDRYNSCKGTYAEVKLRTANVIEYLVKPTLRRANGQWEHMARCASKGVGLIIDGLTFERSLMHLCDVLDFEIPATIVRVPMLDVVAFKVEKFVASKMERIPSFGRFLNFIVRWKIKQALNLPVERLKMIRDKCQTIY